MNTLRVKILAAFLAGILSTLGVLIVHDFITIVNFRLDRIERYLAGPQLQQIVPQSVPGRSHKHELSKPQQWKV